MACGVPRPDTEICVVNVPGGYQKCYNMHDDYDDAGRLKKDATPLLKPVATLDDLNKNICTDIDGFTNLKIYINLLKVKSGVKQ